MMLGKIFALAGVVSVAGLTFAAGVSGCSSDGGVDTSVTDAKADRTPVTVDDSGDVALCYSDEALSATGLSYNSANLQPGACTTANVDDLVNFIKTGTDITYDDIIAHAKTYGASCAACVSSDATAKSWAPILTLGGKFSESNPASCFEIVSGSKACGQAYYQWNFCVDFACQNCGDQTSYQACQDAVPATACAAATAAVSPACGGALNLAAYVKLCTGTYGLDAWISRACVDGAPLTDAGTDGGDAGDGGDGGPH